MAPLAQAHARTCDDYTRQRDVVMATFETTWIARTEIFARHRPIPKEEGGAESLRGHRSVRMGPPNRRGARWSVFLEEGGPFVVGVAATVFGSAVVMFSFFSAFFLVSPPTTTAAQLVCAAATLASCSSPFTLFESIKKGINPTLFFFCKHAKLGSRPTTPHTVSARSHTQRDPIK